MIIHNKPVVVYDIEIFPNFFHCSCKNTETKQINKFEISTRKIEIDELVKFFSGTYLFCGYNNKSYDDTIIKFIIDVADKLKEHPFWFICNKLYQLSQMIVTDKPPKRWMYMNTFDSFDLLTMMFSSKLRVGLKDMQITMMYDNVQEYNGDFTQMLPDVDIEKVISYNINDVESTEELLNRLREKGEIDVRLFMEDEYGINALSMDSVKFGETMLLEEYCKRTGLDKSVVRNMRSPMDYVPLKNVILPFIKYDNPVLQQVLDDMKKQIVPTKKELLNGKKAYENKFYLEGTYYSVGVGGIHSINTPEIFIPKDDEFIGHDDVQSMYPSFIVQYKWIPKHLGLDFWEVYQHIYHERLDAKHSGQKTKSTALKLVLNSVTGKMQQDVSWMYDPESVFKIRINGQLVLLMLVDKLLKLGCKIVQINTDGAMYIGKKKNKEAILSAVHEIEQLTRLNFEHDEYFAFYQFAINDYFGITKDGIEEKGMFITKPKLGKGLSPLVIPKAVINYFINKQDISEFIKNDKNIQDFLMTQRVDKKFKVVYCDKKTVHVNRYYASTNGCHLYKVSPTGQINDMLVNSGVTILNKFDNKPITDINYSYYTFEARKIIDKLSCRQLSLF